MEPLAGKADWQSTLGLAQALGCDWDYESRTDHAGDIRTTPTFAGVTYEKLSAWAAFNGLAGAESEGTPTMHEESFTRGLGRLLSQSTYQRMSDVHVVSHSS